MAIITISRGSLSGGTELATRLGEALGYKVLSREVIVDAANMYGVSEQKLSETLEHAPGLWAKFSGSEENYLLAVQATLADRVSDGNVIYHGLGGRFLLAGLPGVLRVRLIAPMSFRVNAASARLNISREQALAHIQKIDREREKWVKSLYGEDWADPSHYDVVINLGDMSLETAAKMVQCMVSGREFAWTEQARRAVKDFAVQNRVRAHLRFRSRWPDLAIHVKVKNGLVQLSGEAAFESAREEIERFVQSIEGVTLKGAKAGEAEQREGSERLARDVMIPINRYPHIGDQVTLREAIGAIASSSVRLEDGFTITPRYVLVFDSSNKLTGVISRRDLLRGLAPGYLHMKRAYESVAGMLPTMADGFEQALAWNSLFSPGALQNAREPVRTIMEPPKAVLNVDDTVGAVVSAMLLHKVDLVPVVDGGNVVGVVLMTDIFDSVAQFILEGGKS